MSRVPGRGWREGLGQQGIVRSLWEEIGKGAPTGPLADTAVSLATKREIFVPPSPTSPTSPTVLPSPCDSDLWMSECEYENVSLPTQKPSCCPGSQL